MMLEGMGKVHVGTFKWMIKHICDGTYFRRVSWPYGRYITRIDEEFMYREPSLGIMVEGKPLGRGDLWTRDWKPSTEDLEAKDWRRTCPSDPCEYNPKEKRAAFDNEVHAQAEVIVGAKGQWRLCKSCAELPEFKRFRRREKISAIQEIRVPGPGNRGP